MYAGRKRRKPAQKGVKATPAEGAKSNPSKRHRDRLNSELDRLASLLPFPEEVVSSLDKLSILRLSVSFLRNKSFFSVALNRQQSSGETRNDAHSNQKTSGQSHGCLSEGEFLLQALNGFVLVVTADGIIFYCSNTIQDYLGFHQTDVMHQSVFDMIHTEDQQEFRRNLNWTMNPEAVSGTPADSGGGGPTSLSLVDVHPDHQPPENSFLERCFVCRFRCLLDNSSGFLALNIQGRLKFLHGQSGKRSVGGASPQLALFAIATPMQPPAILEIRTKNMIFRTKHKLDFTPMACDAKGKIVLGYTEAELRVRGSGYQFIHAADMLYCAENHVRMMKTGESGLTVFRLLTKANHWKWVQANARLVYKNGQPDYIIATQRPLAEEEGGEHLRKRSMHLPFTFATGEALLYHTGYPLHGFPDSTNRKTKASNSRKNSGETHSSSEASPKSLLGALMSQDESVYVCQPDTKTEMNCSLFAEPVEKLGSWLGDESWHVLTEGRETGACNSSHNPLLASLDNLSLDGDELCSNSELFNALENLGLNAEDLELLLLDERMIQVEVDPSHIPTLGDLLSNNEMLSYIQGSIVTRGEESETGTGLQNTSTTALNIPQHLVAPPIAQFSQQMQRHIQAGELRKSQQTGDWSFQGEDLHQLPATVPSPPFYEEHKALNSLRDSRQEWLLPQGSPPISNLGQFGPKDNFIPKGLHMCPPKKETGHSEICLATSLPLYLQGNSTFQQQMLQQVPTSCLSECPTQNSALEIEELLALSDPQGETDNLFNSSSQDLEKLDNGCLLSDTNATNATYNRSCLMPNSNAVSAPRPTGLPVLQDSQKSGYLL
ncbi:aryl hydrocarbon receptor-like isoform X1 [Synchiropus splendidus]|uniref:aryl hydrocarbon receptor-like isoform X1 n=1 Tax=Synchiropus splendidus TaxID=270530 RepID=UPI00237DD3E6|nr:aryl hydrocarbon receptor-like isoform X1 [Synchiropus splendidus]